MATTGSTKTATKVKKAPAAKKANVEEVIESAETLNTANVEEISTEVPVNEEEAANIAVVAGIEEVKSDIAEEAPVAEPVAEPEVVTAVEQAEKLIEAKNEADGIINNLNEEIMKDPANAKKVVETAQKKLVDIKKKVSSGNNNFTTFWNGINTGW